MHKLYPLLHMTWHATHTPDSMRQPYRVFTLLDSLDLI